MKTKASMAQARIGGRRAQLGKTDWVNAAKAILIKKGISEVKVERIAAKLKVTIGSFYWHFSGRPELYDAIIHDWLTTNTKPLEIAVKNAGDDPRLEYLAFFGVWVLEKNFNPAYDNAVRVWSHSSPKVAEILRQVEAERIEILIGIFKRFGFVAHEAKMRALVTYFHQVGYYALDVHENTEKRVELAPDYAKILVGHDWMEEFRGTDKIMRAMNGEPVKFSNDPFKWTKRNGKTEL